MSGLSAITGASWNQVQSTAELSTTITKQFDAKQLADNAFGSAQQVDTSNIAQQPRSRHEEPRNAREAFQDFVAGTFYKEMLKSLRSSSEKPAYFHGGQAEEMFQSQLDQQVAEDFARIDGAKFSDTLYQAMMQRDVAIDVPAPATQVEQAYNAT